MTPGDIVSGAAWLVLIAGGAILISRSAAANKAAAEQRERNEVEAKEQLLLAQEAEVAFVNEANAMLPDADRAFTHLKTRYGWQEILECSHIGVLERRLFNQIIDGSEVELPNLNLVRSDPDARRLIQRARSLAPPPGWPEDVEGLIQEPTVQTLLMLQASGLLEAKPLEREPTKMYSVTFTEAGRRLERFDSLFRDKGQHAAWPNARPGQKVQRHVANVVRNALWSPYKVSP